MTVLLTRFLPAPPAEVFAAFVDPEEIRRWWGPRGCETTEAEVDLRPGGRCRWVMRFDGEERVLHGRVVEFERDRRLVLENMWDTPESHATLITIEIRPRGAGSELTIRHEQLPEEAAPEDFRRGWISSLSRLEEFWMNATQLARAWIEGWIADRPEEIPLVAEFTHTSPFGTIEGRDRYLEWMKPTAGKRPSLEIVKTMGEGDEAAIWYEMKTPSATIQCCDWIRARGGEIAAITSFYDATGLR